MTGEKIYGIKAGPASAAVYGYGRGLWLSLPTGFQASVPFALSNKGYGPALEQSRHRKRDLRKEPHGMDGALPQDKWITGFTAGDTPPKIEEPPMRDAIRARSP